MNNTENEDNQLDKIKSFYDLQYYQFVKPINSTPTRHSRSLAKKLNINNNTQVLDVACGTGEWLSACKELGAGIAGVDLSEKAIDTCKKSFADGEFYSTPAETLPFSNNKFDIVSCLGSLEHFVNPKKAIHEMVRVAKKDAIFLLLVPNKDFLTRKLGLFSGTNQVDAKEDVKTLDEWNALFEDSGLLVKQRWKDLHVLSWQWMSSSKWYLIPVRLTQALLLTIWPLKWQYQVFHLCVVR
jgi:ubiquinone/menaquinone biosynthesis C-methylase UbiE